MIKYETMLSELYKGIDGLYEETTDYYRLWMRHVAQREVSRLNNGLKHKESTRYELRLELKTVGFGIYWYSVRFVKNGSRLVRLCKMIALPKTGQYTKANFKDATEWELNLILNAEEQLGRVRKQLKHLVSAHTSVLLSSKATGVKVKQIPISKRVNKIDLTIQDIKKQLI
jgi:hypothetical protein